MIPKILHLCWLSGDAYPPLIAKCINSWKEKCPSYTIKIWSSETFDLHSSIWVREAFDQKKYAFAADYIRFWVLYHEGGIYLDSDVEVIKSFDDLLHLNSFMGFAIDGNYEPAIIGSIPGQEWIFSCLQYYNNRHFIKDDHTLDELTLPLIINPILQKTYGLEPKNIRHQISYCSAANISLYPCEYFSPDVLKMRITPHSYTVHHTTGHWRPFSYKIKKQIFSYIVNNKILFFVYTNTYQLIKKWLFQKIWKRDYIPYQ